MAKDEIHLTDNIREKVPRVGHYFQRAGAVVADDLVDMGGLTTSEATSVVAHMMIHAAWSLAGGGRMMDGGVPDPDKFRAAVESAIASISFVNPNDQEQPE